MHLTFSLIAILLFCESNALRQGPTVELRPALESDEAAVLHDQLNRIESKIEVASRVTPVQTVPMTAAMAQPLEPPHVLDTARLQYDLARHSVREQDETAREEDLERLASSEEDAKEEGKLKGLGKASLDATAKLEADAAKQHETEEHVLKEGEGHVAAIDDATKKDMEAEESDEEERAEKEEENAAGRAEHAVVGDSDLAFEDENVAALESADKAVKEAEGLNKELDTKDTAEAKEELDTAMADEEKEVKAEEGETPAAAGTGENEEKETPIQPFPTGAMDHPCPCIQELMKEPCPAAPTTPAPSPKAAAKGGEGCKGGTCPDNRAAAEKRLIRAEEHLKDLVNEVK